MTLSGEGAGTDIRRVERPLRTQPPPATPRFSMPRRDPRAMRWVGHLVVAVACVNILLFGWSICRRIWQVPWIELRVSSAVVEPGVTISADVITTGEVDNPMALELVQGARRETLWERRAHIAHVRSYDPRLYRYTPSVVITPEMLAGFVAGAATLRLTGFGMQKLLRTPPPRIRELHVTIRAR